MKTAAVLRLNLSYLAIGVLLLSGCEKVPLHENPGTFDVLAAHYFEEEKTQYVFFSVRDLKPEQAQPSWPNEIQLNAEGVTSPAFKAVGDGFNRIDFSKTVHTHHMQACGEGRLCGSLSFRAETAPTSMNLKFKYHVSSPMNLEAKVNNSVHRKGDTASSQSALVYGVFNSANDLMQVRVHNNFGTPNDQQLPQFGMERVFKVSDVRLADVSSGDQDRLEKASSTALLYPANSVCESARAGQPSTVGLAFSGKEAWFKDRLDPLETKSSACFRARMVDRDGQLVTERQALARRNPVLQAEGVAIESPIREARTVPLVISYCLGLPESDAYTSATFLEYQRFLFGLPKSTIDVCFAQNQEDLFARQLEAAIDTKLANARASNASQQDLFLTVIINHRLASKIVRFHEIILEKVGAAIARERAFVSPRLAGAFVYDSDALESRGLSSDAVDAAGIVWCPRKDLSKPGADQGLSSANCSSYRGGKVDLGPVNFKIPLGPFPTLATYVDYVNTYGDAGLARNPKFSVKSVQTTANSVTGQDGFYTFFDGERVSVRAGEGLKFCNSKDSEHLLNNVIAKLTSVRSGASEIPSSLESAQQKTLSPTSDLNVDLGLTWEYPFVGGLTFETPIEGKVFEVIPIQTSFGNSQKVGDQKWTRASWPVGATLQKCTLYCDHPFFDEAGVYQNSSSWRADATRCPQPQTVEAPAGVLN